MVSRLHVNVALSAFAAERRTKIDISCPPTVQQQTHGSGVRLANDGTDGQTDRRTPDRYIEPASHTMPSVPKRVY